MCRASGRHSCGDGSALLPRAATPRGRSRRNTHGHPFCHCSKRHAIGCPVQESARLLARKEHREHARQPRHHRRYPVTPGHHEQRPHSRGSNHLRQALHEGARLEPRLVPPRAPRTRRAVLGARAPSLDWRRPRPLNDRGARHRARTRDRGARYSLRAGEAPRRPPSGRGGARGNHA